MASAVQGKSGGVGSGVGGTGVGAGVGGLMVIDGDRVGEDGSSGGSTEVVEESVGLLLGSLGGGVLVLDRGTGSVSVGDLAASFESVGDDTVVLEPEPVLVGEGVVVGSSVAVGVPLSGNDWVGVVEKVALGVMHNVCGS